jgi:hypothetical protein
VGLKPGKPEITLPSRSRRVPNARLMYLSPYSALNLLYPLGSCGSTSGAPWLAAEHTALLIAQWIAAPSKSTNCWPADSPASGEFGPKILGTSTDGFSIARFALEKVPTSQPARVKGTHGAGAFFPSARSIP